MKDLPVYFAALGFALMGLGALFKPSLVTVQFGIPTLTAAGRNEVRAVYGSFGVTMAAVLMLALTRADLRAGILLTLGGALAGMAGGRALSAAIDRRIDKGPLLYLLLEAVIAAGLLHAI